MAGIYVHIPFCHAKCAYCDFYSVANTLRMTAFCGALEKEWHARRVELREAPVRTLYFGGGTPSILPAGYFARLASLFPKTDLVEFTIEVNPEDVNREAADTWLRAGVNRVSMGVQSLVDEELMAVGRRHSAETVRQAVECLQRAGISNISCDLIYGLPGQTVQTWEYSLGGLLDMDIKHLSAYCLSYEPGTRLYMKRERGEVEETDDETLEKMYRILCRKTAGAGMRHYEISNFALPGFESRHNSSYWNLTPYLGLGPGAHSLGSDGVRRFNPSSLKEYIQAPETTTQTDDETETERFNDLLLISLRTAHGLPKELIPSNSREEFMKSARPFIDEGALVDTGSALLIPEEKWLVSDAILRELFLSDRADHI